MYSKVSKTQKLFYGTYLYKIQFKTPLGTAFRMSRTTKKLSYKRYDELMKQLGSNHETKITRWKIVTRLQLNEAKSVLDILNNTKIDFKIRSEAYSLSVYSNDLTLLDQIENQIGMAAKAILFRPLEGSEEYLLTNKDVMVTKNPSEFNYKVVLKNKHGNYDALVHWLTENPDKAKAGASTLRNLRESNHFSGNYFFVKDPKVLMIVEMIAGKIVNKIEKVIHIDDIDK